jgi:hypothetical protein
MTLGTVFFSSPKHMLIQYLTSGRGGRFHPHPFQFIIHYYPTVQTGSGVHPTSYTMGTGGKAAGA